MFDRKLFFKLFWPVLIEQALATTIGMVNTMMVSSVGMTAISAVSIVASLNYLIMEIFTCFATGATVIVAQSMGGGDMDRANKTAVQSMTLCVLSAVICCLLFLAFGRSTVNFLFGDAEEEVKQYAEIYLNYSALSYPFLAAFSMASGILRGSGNTRSSMRISILSNAVNVGVGALCIYLLGWGVSGVGVALLASRIVSAFLIIFILYHNDGVNIRKMSLKLERSTVVPVLKIGVPAGIDGFIFNGGKLLIQTFVTELGTAALAANSIAGSITDLINIPGNSLSLVAVTMVGQAVGSGIYGKKLRKIFGSLTGYAIALLVATTLIMVPLLPLITHLYGPPDDVESMVFSVLRMVLLVMPPLWPVAFILPSCIRSTGDSAHVTIVSVLSMWFVRVLGAWFTVRFTDWGLFGIWVFWLLDWVARAIAFLIRARTSPYVSGKRWQERPKNV